MEGDVMELDKHVAIVTGGGRGIGRATALELARMGATIVVAELDAANAQRTADEVAKLGRPSLGIATDVTKRADLEAMVRATRERFDRIDVLINNAGIYRAAATLDVTEEHWDTMMAINARAVFFTTQAVLPTMIAQHRGCIISLASMAGKIGSRTNLPYNVSKAAVISMTKSLAHVDQGFPGSGRSARHEPRRLHQGPTEQRAARAHGDSGGRRERDRLPGLVEVGLHDGPGAQRRRRPRHALMSRRSWKRVVLSNRNGGAR
ncbi:MAG: hypothetical protein DMD91_05795 [Candidatus Rokuibacteriota bacterium]|nr:MAG: hypothetical protein DMD91_05795 [Candidatus Rokubacteria bacterium]